MALRTKQIPIDDLTPHPENVNEGDVGAITQSLEYHGQYRAIVVSEKSGHILAGNHTWMAAKALGWDKITVHLIPDLTPEQELRIMVADNRYAQLATMDRVGLGELLKGLTDTEDGLQGVGYDGDDLDALLADVWPDTAYTESESGGYSHRIESPIYEPSGKQPKIDDIYDTERYDELIASINEADLPDNIAAFLTAAAARHIVFRYDEIASYYAHAAADIQRLMEASALVIIDFDQAVERGFVTLTNTVQRLFEEEYPDA